MGSATLAGPWHCQAYLIEMHSDPANSHQSDRLPLSSLINLISTQICSTSAHASMDNILRTLPAQFTRWAETAKFIVNLEAYFTAHVDRKTATTFAELPCAPDHLDREAVDKCRAIATMLAIARTHKCKSAIHAPDAL